MKHPLLCLSAFLLSAVMLDAQQIKQKPRIGVVRFSISSISIKDIQNAAYIRLLTSKNIGVSKKLFTIDIQTLDTFMGEHDVSILKLYKPEEMEKIPLNFVQYLVTGFITLEENHYRVKINMLDLGQRKFLFSEEILMDSKDENTLWDGVKLLTDKFLWTFENTILTYYMESEKQYKIGDRGPAGGFIFYVKSAYSGGWRYLEAAPPETEFRAQWGIEIEGIVIPSSLDTQSGIGTGRDNTEIFMAHPYLLEIKNRLTANLAATACRAINFGGYSDWFLPSKDELMLMYTNLASRGLGGFKDETYWSSTESSYEYAHFQSFREGRQFFNGYKIMPLYVRAVRAF
ncbi:MAG: DUF1566 domain-containing protein [Treponema sp.]|jgi:TolB-like protein|nr:DUF1566 domain-containing protein [Treponema sp.]